MSGEITMSVVGNLTDAPTRNTTNTGRTVTNFTIASTSRVYDRQTGQYKDGNTVYMRCSAWGDLAEHILATCVKGTRVVAVGELRQHNYQDENGQRHNRMELTVNELGASLRYATAQITKTTNGNGYSGGMNGGYQPGGYNGYQQQNGYGQFNDPYNPGNQYAQQPPAPVQLTPPAAPQAAPAQQAPQPAPGTQTAPDEPEF